MAFRITLTEEADSHWRALSSRERSVLQAAIEARLTHQPKTATNAVKRLRTNPFAEFEMRVGDLRVLYNVECDEVVLLLIGRKVGNTLIVKGQEFHGHENNPTEPT